MNCNLGIEINSPSVNFERSELQKDRTEIKLKQETHEEEAVSVSRWNKGLLVCIAATILTACANTPEKVVEEGGVKLDNAALQEIYNDGAKVAWTAASGTSGTSTYGADGSSTVSFNSTRWSGSWRIEDDTVCTSYRERDDGAERCTSRYQRETGEIVVFNRDGEFVGNVTVVE